MTGSYTTLIAKAAKGTLTDAERIFLARLERTGVLPNYATSLGDDSDKDDRHKKMSDDAALFSRIAGHMALPTPQTVTESNTPVATRRRPAHTRIGPRDEMASTSFTTASGGHAERPIEGIAFKERPVDLRAPVMKKTGERSFAETASMPMDVGPVTYTPETHAPKKLSPSFADVAAKGDIVVQPDVAIKPVKKTNVVHTVNLNNDGPLLQPPTPSFFN